MPAERHYSTDIIDQFSLTIQLTSVLKLGLSFFHVPCSSSFISLLILLLLYMSLLSEQPQGPLVSVSSVKGVVAMLPLDSSQLCKFSCHPVPPTPHHKSQVLKMKFSKSKERKKKGIESGQRWQDAEDCRSTILDIYVRSYQLTYFVIGVP